MPTDDDYGRRDRLLLHQHPITQYGSSSSPLPGSSAPSSSGVVGLQINSNNSNDCFKQQVQQQQQLLQQQQSSDLRAVTSTASQLGPERYQSDQQIQSSEHVGARMVDRHEKSVEKATIDFSKCGEGRPSSCDRFGHYQAQSGEHASSRMGVERHEKDKSCVDYAKCGEVRQSSCERYGHYQAQNGDQTHVVVTRMAERHEKPPPSDKPSIDFTKCIGDGRQSSCEHFGHYQTPTFGQSPLQGHYGATRSADRFARFNDLSTLHGTEQRGVAPPTSADRYSICNSELRFDTSTAASEPGEYANTNALASTFSTETFPSPPSPAPANDRFVPPPPLSPSPSEKYASSQSLAGYPVADRVLPHNSPGPKYGTGGTAPASPMPSKERFASAERLLAGQQSVAGDAKDQQRYSGPPDRLLSGSSPVLGGLQAGLQAGLQSSGLYAKETRYAAISADRLLSSSPIHAPVPERFAGKSDRYLADSPIHDRYPRQDPPTGTHHERYSAMATATERFLSNSPNPESAHQRYSSSDRSSLQATSSGTEQSTRRLYTDRGVETVCQKYTDRSTSSPASVDFARYSGFSEVSASQTRFVSSNDRFNDLALQRCGQSRSSADRFSSDHYVTGSSPAHDGRLSSAETSRYIVSSTERLLAPTSSSPSSSSETGTRYHSSYTTTTGTQSSASGDRFASISPTPEMSPSIHRGSGGGGGGGGGGGNSGGGYQNAKSTVDKYLVSKSVQSGFDRYTVGGQSDHQFGQDRYYASGSGNDRFQTSTGADRFHAAADRYSPARSVADKYLSLPKPKDRFTGRITPISCATAAATSSTDRSYGSSSVSYVPPTAHTPVERYVPQPPPEVLYPDRYVDRYVPPAAHTPTDRYVPANDPGDPYMRRDLGFHHHYRLPPPTGYPYQTHFRFRGFTSYATSGRLGGSPGSSSSSSTTSNQRETFATSPLLRPKVRASTVEFGTAAGTVGGTAITTATAGVGVTVGRHVCTNQVACCGDASTTGRTCCQMRRSLPPGTLPTIPAQTSSWQASPSSGTTGTSTVSSTTGEGDATQNIGMYPMAVATSSAAATATPVTTTASATTSVPLTATSGTGSQTGIARSVSAPSAPRPVIQITSSSASASATQRPRLRRNLSRTEAIRNYIRRETAQFFGVDEESETLEKQRWLDRRRRMASRKYGALVPEHRPPDPDITRDVPDTTEIQEGVTLRRWQQPVRRKDSVARITLSGLHYIVESLTKQRPRERSQPRPESRSFPPSVIAYLSRSEEVSYSGSGQDEEESFFERPPPPPPPLPPPSSSQQSQTQVDQASSGLVKDEDVGAKVADILGTGVQDREGISSEELVGFAQQKDDRTTIDGQVRRPRQITRDHYTSRKTSWSRSKYDAPPADGTRVSHDEGVTLRRELVGATRISPSTIDRVFDNSNRRQYGMGIVGRFFGRSFRKSVARKPDIKKQLDDFEDHRPYFTYWITTVQVLILIISLACYGFGPVGMDLNHRSGLVLVTSLSLQQVDYQEPANFWLGPRAADLIHLGAKFAPCMRRDIKILKEIDVWRERERDTACCIRNDDSGCVQSSKADCSNTISTWKKWGPGDSGPGGRISGSVCGLDPKFCDAPASIAPYEWPDDITKWPICRKTNPFNQRFSKNGNQRGNGNFPIGRYKDKMAEHMVCEVIGHPCCIGIHGMCRITTKEYCDFVHGYFHEEASLCSQVECLHDVCGMIPFLHPEWPDQFYRLFTTTFLHAGIVHLAITLLIQYFLMRDLEKLTGSLRIAFIYFIGALAGNLASAIFVPYRAEVGPAGAHFALLATLVVEVLHCWPMLKHPRRALSKLILILLGLLVLGILPWVDNYAHLFGFIFGFLAAYALMPFISFGHYDRRRKILLIWVCLILIVGLFALLLALFYNVPVYECEVCKLFNCVPFTRDFCASQNINFKREEPV